MTKYTAILSVFLLHSQGAYSFVPPTTPTTRTASQIKTSPSTRLLEPLAFFGKATPEPEPIIVAIPGVGDEGCALESPSKVNTLPEPIQAAIVFGILATLGIATVPFSNCLSNMTVQ